MPSPSADTIERLKQIVAPHVHSFDYALEHGLGLASRHLSQTLDLSATEGNLTKTCTLNFRLEALEIGRPQLSAFDRISYDEALRKRQKRRGLQLLSEDEKVDDEQTPGATHGRLLPRECRERGLDYSAPLRATLVRRLDKGPETRETIELGQVPLMVGSNMCLLSSKSPKELAALGEDEMEMGGYFICNGNERVIRLLQLPRRNYPLAIERASFRDLGPGFTSKAVQTRCVSSDHISSTLTLHYTTDGTTRVRIRIRKTEYNVPLALLFKALADTPMTTDFETIRAVSRGHASDSFAASRIELELGRQHQAGASNNANNANAAASAWWTSSQHARSYLGQQFRHVLVDIPRTSSDAVAGDNFIKRHIMIHLESYRDKYDFLVECTRKLYDFVEGKRGGGRDDPDHLQNQEVLLGGHLYLGILREQLEGLLIATRNAYEQQATQDARRVMRVLESDTDGKDLKAKLQRQGDVGRRLFGFLNTGNLVSATGLDMSQTTGFTVVADKLNRLRYLAHFAAVHRGSFFAEMKTTAGRKLLPEAWGFLCPVHTPDGAPCGVLNHLTTLAVPVCAQLSPFAEARFLAALASLLVSWGAHPAGELATLSSGNTSDVVVPIICDGKVLAHATSKVADSIAKRLRRLKVQSMRRLEPHDRENPDFPTAHVVAKGMMKLEEEELFELENGDWLALLEIAYIPLDVALKNKRAPWPGMFLFMQSARLVRPIVDARTSFIEMIGPLEQASLDIATSLDTFVAERHTHLELHPSRSVLSLIASMTPFSDFNQSPRNMYQCQMGKQTMGTPAHSLKFRTDNKLYKLQNPQKPIVQTQTQSAFAIDEFPNGANAVVAVISYTSYDMDDAMIVNKSSMERGFGHASVYKTHFVELRSPTEIIRNPKHDPLTDQTGLDSDGLPIVGQYLQEGDPVCMILDEATHKVRYERHKDAEPCVVEQVRVFRHVAAHGDRSRKNTPPSSTGIRAASITTRYNRNPVVGDKFSSRHGQKGVMSVLWPQQDLPFTESGMVPDVIINPHAFPSRMTIGMLVESMAGKGGALHGHANVDATPFTETQSDVPNETAVDYFGKMLLKSGYAYHGSEPMYSGALGTELKADIFIGVVYYQRLRHMVSDKSQVRALGPVDPVTRQPVKGRKRHGGVRFGEMERDALIAHGTAFLAQDRLLNSSDRHTAAVCCGSFLSSHQVPTSANPSGEGFRMASISRPESTCRLCGRTDAYKLVVIPYALRYMINELAAMGIKMAVEF